MLCYYNVPTFMIIGIALFLRYIFLSKEIKFNIVSTIIDAVLFGIISSLYLFYTWTSCPILPIGSGLMKLIHDSIFVFESIVVLLTLIVVLLKKVLFKKIYSNMKFIGLEFIILSIPRWIVIFAPYLLFWFLK